MSAISIIPMPTIKAECKLCGNKLDVPYDPLCPPHWIRRLLPMVCCSECYDLREYRMKKWFNQHQ